MFCSAIELSSPTSIAATPTPRGRQLLQGSPVIQTGRSPTRNTDPGRGADTLACSFSERAGCHAGACQVGNVVVRAMALAGLRHGAVPYFRLLDPKGCAVSDSTRLRAICAHRLASFCRGSFPRPRLRRVFPISVWLGTHVYVSSLPGM
jgi:hypothetical protein